jgi:hypothetical protein
MHEQAPARVGCAKLTTKRLTQTIDRIILETFIPLLSKVELAQSSVLDEKYKHGVWDTLLELILEHTFYRWLHAYTTCIDKVFELAGKPN